MEYIKLPETDIEVSRMCLGTMMFGDKCDYNESEKIFNKAFENGVNFFDTAESYFKGEAERILGNLIKDRREKVVIITKGHISDNESLEEKIDKSLKRLNTDYIDFYLIHWPKKNMKIEKVMNELNLIVKKGKARYIGCSNYPLWLLSLSNEFTLTNNLESFKLLQIPYNIIERGVEVELFPYILHKKIAVVSYRPLVMGFLTGKYRPDKEIPADSRGKSDERIEYLLNKFGNSIIKFIEFASEKDISPAQLAIMWVRYNNLISAPIVGASSEKQLDATLKAFNLNLTEEEYNTITSFFDTEVKEESLGKFKSLRREKEKFLG